MKKLLLSLLVIPAFAFAFVGCTENEPEDTAEEVEEAAEETAEAAEEAAPNQ